MDRAVEQIGTAERSAARGLVGATKLEARGAADHADAGDAREAVDDLFADAIGEELQVGVVRQVVERQHGDGRRARGRCGGSDGSRLHAEREPVATARDRRDRATPEKLAQRGDLHGEVVLLDLDAGPHALEQLILADDAIAMLDQHEQQVERARAQRNDLTPTTPDVRRAALPRHLRESLRPCRR